MSWDIVYYPEMSIPSGGKFSQFALYFDTCGVIVPWRDYDEDQDEVTRELRGTFVTPLSPMELYDWNTDRDQKFCDELIAHFKSTRSRVSRSSRHDLIHLGKLNNTPIISVLEEHHLAFRTDRGYYSVPRPYSTAVMAYLAYLVGSKAPVWMTPATARVDAASLVMQMPLHRNGRRPQGSADRLRKVLVSPVGVDLRDVYNFRLRYSRELQEFRKYIEFFVALSDDDAERELRIMAEFQQMFAEKMRKHGWSRLKCTDLAWSSLTGGLSGIEGAPVTGVSGVLRPLIGVVTRHCEIRMEKEQLMRDPYAYAALSAIEYADPGDRRAYPTFEKRRINDPHP